MSLIKSLSQSDLDAAIADLQATLETGRYSGQFRQRGKAKVSAKDRLYFAGFLATLQAEAESRRK